MNELEIAQKAAKAWDEMRADPKRTTTFQAFMDSLNETSVKKAKVKFGKEWGEEK